MVAGLPGEHCLLRAVCCPGSKEFSVHSSYRNSRTWLILVAVVLAVGFWEPVSAQPLPPACPGTLDYFDDTYGSQVRQLYDPSGHEHNTYYHRDPWNANNTYMVGIKEDLDHTHWRVVLYDGNGCFVKVLFPVSQY